MILIVTKTDDLNRSALNESKEFKQSIVTVALRTRYHVLLNTFKFCTFAPQLTRSVFLLNHCK